MIRHTTMAILLCGALLGGTLAAQQTAEKPANKGSQMSMDGMMRGCREHCEANSKSMDAMEKAMQSAASSSDPARMRTALTDAQKQVAEMRKHMGMCMNMMTMMEKMHGGTKKP